MFNGIIILNSSTPGESLDAGYPWGVLRLIMISELSITDIPQVVKIHMGELHGFLPKLGQGFLTKFYEKSLDIPEMFTLVEKENEQVYGFITGVTRVKWLYVKVFSQDIISFIMLFLGNFITHPENIIKSVRSLAYPGFTDDIPEILTIAVKKSCQGQGTGGKLFREAANEFQKRGFGKFRVSTYDKLPANEFYKKIGCRFERSFIFLNEKMNYYIFEI